MISIIIPHYNHHQALQKALRSIASQTVTNYEVIVVDDGSKDPIDVKSLSHIIPKVIVISLEKNGGAPTARNVGLAHAQGTSVIFWDADVIAEPHMLKEMHAVLQSNEGVSFVYSDFYFGKKLFKVSDFSVTKLLDTNYIHSTSLVRRMAALEWDVSLKRFQDWDYWLTLAEGGHIGYHVDAPLFRVLPGGTMSTWLPSFAYKKPWSLLPGIRSRVEKYNDAKRIMLRKHR